MGKPNSWITLQVMTDGFGTRRADLPEEVPNVSLEGANKRSTSGKARQSEALGVADDSVVVMSPEPMNFGNKRKGETWGTFAYAGGATRPKA